MVVVGWLVVFFFGGGGDLDIHIDVIGDQGSSVGDDDDDDDYEYENTNMNTTQKSNIDTKQNEHV